MDIFAASVMIGLVVLIFWLVDSMAEKRRRNRPFWFLVALLINPLFAIVILLLVGEAHDD
jgi:putative effector of murein hydrolase